MNGEHAESTTPVDVLSTDSVSEPPQIEPFANSIDPGSIHNNDSDAVDPAALNSSVSDLESQSAVGDTATLDDDRSEWDHELKRVKVYELVGSRWIDQGTAFCCGSFSDDTGDALLVARAENDHDHIILSTTIRRQEVYQRQQETLIVWTEPDGMDYALSFQDPDGCLEVWNFIEEVQRYLNTAEQQATSTLSDTSPATASIVRSGHLPKPTTSNVRDIDAAMKALARTQAVKERLCEYIQSEDYLKALVGVLQEAEKTENLSCLHALYSLMHTILQLNDHTIYEHILDDSLFLGIVGILEYDPDFPQYKANYRDFLAQTLHFHQPIPVTDSSIQRKIHQTYRLQFLKDVVLARVLDDATFNVLNSSIIFNQIDIIQYVQQDAAFLGTVVRLYIDEDTLSGGVKVANQNGHPVKFEGAESDVPSSDAMDIDLPEPGVPQNPVSQPEPTPSLQRDVVRLIQQLCIMGKTVQLPARVGLFRTLVDRGILFAVQWAMGLPEKEDTSRTLICAAGEILSSVLEHDLHGARGHVMKQHSAIEKQKLVGKKGADKAETLLQLLCRTLAHSRDVTVQSQIGDTLRTWLEIPSNDNEPLTGIRAIHRGKDEAGTERFLDYFYDKCAKTLFSPLEDLSEWKQVTEPILPLTKEMTNLYLYLCELLHNFGLQHSFRSQVFLLQSDVSVRVASLLKAKDKHLRHAAFRYFRGSLKSNFGNLRSHFIKRDILKPILELTLRESRRDNLVASSCYEFFEYVRRENVKEFIKHCMEHHEPLVRRLADTPLGKQRIPLFIQRWEMNNEPSPEEDKSTEPVDPRSWLSSRAREVEEEEYFNGGDDDDEAGELSPSTWSQSIPSVVVNNPSVNIARRKRRPSLKGPKPVIQALGTLVDYGEEEEETVIGPTPLDDEGTTPRPPSPSPSLKDEDDDDDSLLESLYRSHVPTLTPSPRTMEKRRRDDDDDELVQRISRVKKQKGVTQPNFRALTKGGDDPSGTTTKKIKLKLGAIAATVASVGAKDSPPGADVTRSTEEGITSNGNSDNKTKDVDTG